LFGVAAQVRALVVSVDVPHRDGPEEGTTLGVRMWRGEKRDSEMIPILDLKAQYESIKDEIDAAIAEVLESGQFILGRRCGTWSSGWRPIAGASTGWG
jgi:hypothetical protein